MRIYENVVEIVPDRLDHAIQEGQVSPETARVFADVVRRWHLLDRYN
jgi:hypothetical protein